MNPYRKGTRWHHHPLFLFCLLLLLGIFVRSTFVSFQKRKTALNENEKFNQEYESLEAKKIELEANIESLESERGREEEYRERYNVVKEGEKVIRIVEEE